MRKFIILHAVFAIAQMVQKKGLKVHNAYFEFAIAQMVQKNMV